MSFHAEGVGAMGKAPSPRRYSSIICCLACLQAASWGAFSTAPPTRIESANSLEIPSMSCSSNSAILADRSSPLWSSRPLSRAEGLARIRGGPRRLQGRWTGCGPKKLLCFHPGRLRAAYCVGPPTPRRQQKAADMASTRAHLRVLPSDSSTAAAQSRLHLPPRLLCRTTLGDNVSTRAGSPQCPSMKSGPGPDGQGLHAARPGRQASGNPCLSPSHSRQAVDSEPQKTHLVSRPSSGLSSALPEPRRSPTLARRFRRRGSSRGRRRATAPSSISARSIAGGVLALGRHLFRTAVAWADPDETRRHGHAGRRSGTEPVSPVRKGDNDVICVCQA